MPFLIGTDEAGYGPHYGPLVVSATVWEIDDGIDPAALYKHLRHCVAANLKQATNSQIVWADSKAVYKSGAGFDHLERGVLAALGLTGRMPTQWCQLWDWLDPEIAPRIGEFPWHFGYSADLPFCTDAEKLSLLVDALKIKLAEQGVRLINVLCRAVFPDEFNELVEGSNKADALSKITLALSRQSPRTYPRRQRPSFLR